MTIIQRVSVDRIVDVLNKALTLDPEAMTALVNMRVPCNEALAQHPTIEVLQQEDSTYRVGLVGILNGICRECPIERPIVAEFSDNGQLIRFVHDHRTQHSTSEITVHTEHRPNDAEPGIRIVDRFTE